MSYHGNTPTRIFKFFSQTYRPDPDEEDPINPRQKLKLNYYDDIHIKKGLSQKDKASLSL